MYRQILVPDKKNHSIELPEGLYGKKIEVIAFEIADEEFAANKQTGNRNFLDDIEPIPDFPKIEEIRKGAWPERW